MIAQMSVQVTLALRAMSKKVEYIIINIRVLELVDRINLRFIDIIS